ncbi:MAG: threonine/serine dehydratase [Pyrinomonadaceae bacterium]
MLSLRDAIRPTTFIESSKLRDHLGLDITIASETFQHTGSFKFRAAYNLALNVPNDNLLTASSGNFGQALAYSCKLLGKRCTVVMPATSAQVKIDAVRGFGATVDLIDTKTVGRSERVAQLRDRMPDAYVASPYDDQLVIDGNATLGQELAAKNFDAIIVPVGGGGLISGTISALSGFLSEPGSIATDLPSEPGAIATGFFSRPEIYGAEPLLANDAARSFKSGQLIANESEPMTIADGARTLSLGTLNWPIIQTGVTDIIEVSEHNIAEALRLYFTLANLKTEPTAALSLGAVLENKENFRDKNLCLIVSGGNVDPDVYLSVLKGSLQS